MVRSSTSSQTFLWVSQRAQGMPSLSINSVCHCSHSVAGAKITIGLRDWRSLSLRWMPLESLQVSPILETTSWSER